MAMKYYCCWLRPPIDDGHWPFPHFDALSGQLLFGPLFLLHPIPHPHPLLNHPPMSIGAANRRQNEYYTGEGVILQHKASYKK
jgi:hypothetical protein